MIFMLFAVIIIIIFLYWQNNEIVVNEIDYKNSDIPDAFNGFKILHISDLHNKEFGKEQKRLVNLTNKINPDIIVITGDFIDSNRTTEKNMNKAFSYVKKVINKVPVYYVEGNHEVKINELSMKLKNEMKNIGVNVLENSYSVINKNNSQIDILGLKDMKSIRIYTDNRNREEQVKDKLKEIKSSTKNKFSILLSHRPELLWAYSQMKINLVFTGHAHGGQIRLPFIGGLYSPSQGLFPKLTNGIKNENDTSMVISRGLGNSRFPFRIFNRPELIVVNLKSENVIIDKR